MSSVAAIYNKDCLKCGKVEYMMVQIGSLVFCDGCFKETFKTPDPVSEERNIYLEWVEEARKKEQKTSTTHG